MRRLILGALLAFLASGCFRQYAFTKPDFDQATFQRDGYECERDLRTALPSFGAGPLAEIAARDFAVRCMSIKGYTLVEVPRR